MAGRRRVAEYAAMNGTHRIEVLGADCKSTTVAAVAGFQTIEASVRLQAGDAIGNVARIGTDGHGFIRHGWFLPGSRRLDAANGKRVCIVYVKHDFGAEILQRPYRIASG